MSPDLYVEPINENFGDGLVAVTFVVVGCNSLRHVKKAVELGSYLRVVEEGS